MMGYAYAVPARVDRVDLANPPLLHLGWDPENGCACVEIVDGDVDEPVRPGVAAVLGQHEPRGARLDAYEQWRVVVEAVDEVDLEAEHLVPRRRSRRVVGVEDRRRGAHSHARDDSGGRRLRLEDDRHRAGIYQRDLHSRAEDAAGHGDTLAGERVTERLVERLGLGR